jgi:ABC-type lipoprotein export system ATPase subunit
MIFQTKRADNKLGLNSGDYRFYSRPVDTAFPMESIVSVKPPQYDCLFHNLDNQKIYLEATLSKNQDLITIGFSIRVGKGHVYVITLDNGTFDYPKFNAFFNHFPEPIKIVYASSSITALKRIEAFETEPKIEHDVRSRESIQVLRNRLYRLYYTTQSALLYTSFIKDLEYILLDNKETFELSFTTEHQKDIYAFVTVKIGNQSTPLDIALLGSGTLQVIEILLSCYEKTADLGIILLDEPDSHIHRDIQKRLLTVLIKHADHKQVFLTTHNESLIRSAKPSYLFHLQASRVGEYSPIVSSHLTGQKIGLQPSHQIKILESLGSEFALDYLNAIEADKLVIVEGRDDARYIQTILRNKHQIADNAPNVMFWAMGGIDEIIKHIETYKHFFSHIKNKESLWDKTVLVFDKDRLLPAHRHNLMVAMKQKLGVNVYIWAAYTIEATILTEIDQLVTLLDKYARYLKSNITVTRQYLQTVVQAEIDDIIVQKKQQIDSVQSRAALQDYFLNKRAKLETHLKLKIKSIMPGANAELSPKVTEETLNALNRGELYTIATKHDVDTLIKNILARLNITLSNDIDYYFIELLELAKYSPWFAEWDNMIQIVSS